ncbi:uncharacterized protein KY384_006420 [Bacidia gigantensis]|uniref:uncharacterized protein n=1 Tax=Bacidia gigantensis TaxID=2732470 RepID=UPI001D040547|nr:uncharacterized protein KY384_006420 [Bacidia gigantensis]KAG8528733.1 hypothetical protein KY384_006420 [Bacidia gigantensis]
MAELVAKLQDLQALPSELHWFCESWSHDDGTTSLGSPIILDSALGNDVELRRSQATECLLLYSYDDAQHFQIRLGQAIDLHLGRCDICIEEYYKAKQRQLENLRHDYEEDEVRSLEHVFNDRDLERISRGLDHATRTLQRLESAQRHKNSLKLHSQLALFEALCNDAFLADENALSSYFQEPFKLVQTNKRLNITRFTPAVTAFLFDANDDRRSWATATWRRYRQPPSKEDFDYAIRVPLSRNMQKVHGSVSGEEVFQRTWFGIGLIIENMNNELVTHSLRAMEIDIFKLALDHLKYEFSSFRCLVETIQKMLELAPKDFWEAMGAMSPTTFVEQIFSNKQYDRFIEQSKPADVENPSALKDMLSWIKPFMTSLDPAHQAGVSRFLASQLLNRLQADRFPESARIECYRTGLATLAWTLSVIHGEGEIMSSTGRFAAKDALEVVGEHVSEIIRIITLANDNRKKSSCSELCLRIVKFALALECKSVKYDYELLTQAKASSEVSAGYGSYVAALWDAVIQSMDFGNVELAKAALVGINDLNGLERLRASSEEPCWKEKSAYNIKLTRLIHLCTLRFSGWDISYERADRSHRDQSSRKSLAIILESAPNDIPDDRTVGEKKVDDSNALKEFCRDTMQFCENLFDQYGIFANAMKSPLYIKNEELSDFVSGSVTGVELLKPAASTLQVMVKWLRLRDSFLVEIAVKLTKKVLNRLTELNMAVEESTSKVLEHIIIGGSQGRTHLTPQEKAELAQSLEANLGRPVKQILDVDSETLSDLSNDSYTAHKTTKKTKLACLDISAWRAKAKSSTLRPTGDADEVFKNGDFVHQDAMDHELLSVSRSVDTMQKMMKQQAHSSTPKNGLPQHEKRKVEAASQLKEPGKLGRPLQTDIERIQFREKREREREAKKRRDAENLAMVKKRANGQALGEGSGLNGIGVKGKDHRPQGPSMMFSSGSESTSEDELDAKLFSGNAKPSKTSARILDIHPGKSIKVLRGPVKKSRQVRSAKDMRARLVPDLTALHNEILGWDFFHNDEYPLAIIRMNVDAFLEISATIATNDAREAGIGEADIVLLSKSESPARNANQPHCFARVWKINRKKNTVEITCRANVNNNLVPFTIPNTTFHCVRILSITPLEREFGALHGLQYFDLCEEIIKARPSPLLDYSEKQLILLKELYTINSAQAKAVKSAIDNDAFTLIQGPPGSGKTKTIVAIVGSLLTGQFDSQGHAISRPHGETHGPRIAAFAAKKLLVCAPSNAAVDELVMRFKQGVKTADGRHQTLSVVRLGRSEAINSNVKDVTLEELVNAKINVASKTNSAGKDGMGSLIEAHKATCDDFNRLRNLVDEWKAVGKPVNPEQNRDMELLKRKKQQISNQIDQARDQGNIAARDAEISRRQIQQEILNNAHVICATLSGSGHEMFHGLNVEFETVVIDEAAQSIELSALIPLKYGCSKCILVGDPKQLPPTVLSREAAKFQFEQSLFVRMQANHPHCVHLLDTQYRMHPEISVFPSNAFYDGRLVDGPSMAEERIRPWHQSSILSPYRFFDVKGFHQTAPKGHSLINHAEIDVALRLYDRLINDCKQYDFHGNVAIITPYKSQLRELRSRFSRQYGDTILTSIEFNTTDAFQGRESEVVIFSCVRASNGSGIGFLSDIRRMNVGITRAKASLWVLGNSHSLMQGEFWRHMIEDAKRRNLYSQGDLVSQLQKPLLVAPAQRSSREVLPQGGGQDIDTSNAPPTSEPPAISIDILERPNNSPGDHDLNNASPEKKTPLAGAMASTTI